MVLIFSRVFNFSCNDRFSKIAVSANLPADNFLDVLYGAAGRVLTPRFVLPAAIAAAAGSHKILRLVAPTFAVGNQVIQRHVFLLRTVKIFPAVDAVELVAQVDREAKVFADLNSAVTFFDDGALRSLHAVKEMVKSDGAKVFNSLEGIAMYLNQLYK